MCYSANDLRLEWGYRSPGIFTRQAYEAPALQAGAETPPHGMSGLEKAFCLVRFENSFCRAFEARVI